MDVWSWVQSVIFLFLGVAATAIYDRWKIVQDDYELWVDCLSSSMKKPGISSSLSPLEYSVQGVTVKDPYEVEVCLWAAGKKDIAPDRFNGHDLIVDLNVPILSELAAPDQVESSEARITLDPAGKIEIAPSVVRRGMAVRWKFVTEGRPSLDWNNPFLDTEVRSWFQEWEKPQPSRKAMKVVGICMLLLFGAWFFLSLILSSGGLIEIPVVVASIIFGLPPTLFIAMNLIARSDGPGRRLSRVRRSLRQRVPGALTWEYIEHTGDPFKDTRVPYGRRVLSSGHIRPPGSAD